MNDEPINNDNTNGNFSLLETDDGSHTIFLRSLGESYHSKYGAFTESRHVYIRHGFFTTMKTASVARGVPVVCEIGMGTGLNMALTYEQCRIYNFPIHYIAIEPHPLPLFLTNKLNYGKFLDTRVQGFWQQLHEASWDVPHRFDDCFSFVKLKIGVEEFESEHLTALVDYMDKTRKQGEEVALADTSSQRKSVSSPETAINANRGISLFYYDGFSPQKNVGVWQLENFIRLRKMATISRPSTLVTFSASSYFRKNLEKSGWKWKSMPGVLGKREITVANGKR